MENESVVKVLIVDDIPDIRESVTKLLLLEHDIDVVGAAADGQQAIDMTGQYRPDVVLMDVHMPGINGISATETICKQWPEVQVVMMSADGEADCLRQAMVSGARDFCIKPCSGEELAESIRRAHRTAEKVVVSSNPQHVQATAAATANPQQDVAPPAPVPPAPTKTTKGQIVTVFAPKGGVGCTTVSCNLAVALGLKTQNEKKVALVDCNLQFGDVALFLDVRSSKSIADVVPYVDSLDTEILESVMAKHDSGIRVLLGPPRPEMAELVTADALKAVLAKLQEVYDYIVIDTWPSFQETMLATMDMADNILTVLTLEMPSIKNVRMFVEIADALGYAPDKINLVLNRSDSVGGIELADVEKSLNRQMVAQIPSDSRLATRALNLGVPFVLCAKDSKLSKGIMSLADYVLAGPVAQKSTESEGTATGKASKRGLGGLFGAVLQGRSTQRGTTELRRA